MFCGQNSALMTAKTSFALQLQRFGDAGVAKTRVVLSSARSQRLTSASLTYSVFIGYLRKCTELPYEFVRIYASLSHMRLRHAMVQRECRPVAQFTASDRA